MKTFRYVALAIIVSAALSMPLWAQGRGGSSGTGQTHAAPPAVQQTTPSASVAAPTHAQATAHRRATHHGDAHKRHADVRRHHGGTHHASTVPPVRANKGGALQGQARAEEVHRMNQEKHAAQKSKTIAHPDHDRDAKHGGNHHEGKRH